MLIFQLNLNSRYFIGYLTLYLIYSSLHTDKLTVIRGAAFANKANSRRESAKAHGQKNNHIIQIFGTQAHPLTEQVSLL